MPSLVTSIIGGVTGASAAHDAASVVSQQAGQVAGNIDTATQNAINYGQKGLDQSNADIQAMLTGAGSAVERGLSTATGALSPYVTAGQGGLSTLASMLGPGGSLITPLTASQVMANDPGYQFREQQGQKALETSTSARGGLLGGAAQKAAMQYGQGFASNEYGNSWNRLMQQRQQQYGMLSGLAGMGMTAGGALTNAAMTGAGLMTNANIAGGNLGVNAALRSNEYMGSTGLAGTEAAGNMLMRGAQATASGDIGAANAWNGMLSGIGNAANSFLMGGFGGGGGFNWGGALSGVPQGPNGPMMPGPWGGYGGYGGWPTPTWNPGGPMSAIGGMDRSSLTMGGAGDADIAAGIYS